MTPTPSEQETSKGLTPAEPYSEAELEGSGFKLHDEVKILLEHNAKVVGWTGGADNVHLVVATKPSTPGLWVIKPANARKTRP